MYNILYYLIYEINLIINTKLHIKTLTYTVEQQKPCIRGRGNHANVYKELRKM